MKHVEQTEIAVGSVVRLDEELFYSVVTMLVKANDELFAELDRPGRGTLFLVSRLTLVDPQTSDHILDMVGFNIRSIRENQNLSLSKVAAKAGISKTYLLGIELRNANPSLVVLLKIADALGVDLHKVIP